MKPLERKLTALFTGCTALLFSCVLLFSMYHTVSQYREYEDAIFRSRLNLCIFTVQSGEPLTEAYLSSLKDFYFLFSYDGDGISAMTTGGWTPETPPEILLKSIKQRVTIQNADNSAGAGQPSAIETTPAVIGGEHRDSYLASAAIVSVMGDKSSAFYLLMLRSPTFSIVRRHLPFYLFIWACGIIFLFFLSRFLIRKAVRPLKEGIKKQRGFIASASHELKSPLSVIMAAGESALQVSQNPPETIRALLISQKECIRMKKLISDMLLLASGDSGNWTLQKSPLRLDDLLIDCFEELEGICRSRNCSLELLLPDYPMQKVSADRERLIQVLHILLDNALTHSPDGSRITIAAGQDGRFLFLSVTDHGSGIAPEDRPFIFERFYQSDKSHTQKDHFGLGLSIAKEILQLHGGKILLTDTPGGGCTFRLLLQKLL